jgi:hypothetical protein
MRDGKETFEVHRLDIEAQGSKNDSIFRVLSFLDRPPVSHHSNVGPSTVICPTILPKPEDHQPAV